MNKTGQPVLPKEREIFYSLQKAYFDNLEQYVKDFLRLYELNVEIVTKKIKEC